MGSVALTWRQVPSLLPSSLDVALTTYSCSGDVPHLSPNTKAPANESASFGDMCTASMG